MTKYTIALIMASSLLSSCSPKEGSYGYDKDFFASQGIETTELYSSDGNSRVLIVPAYQGRVMTSTTGGEQGVSYGWINHKFIASGEVNPQFNSYGGEERFWIGPEGGPFSWYFEPGAEQVYENWLVPKIIDTGAFNLIEANSRRVILEQHATLSNASGITFDMGLRRTISLLEPSEAIGMPIPEGVRALAYSTANTIINEGNSAWDSQSGMPSVWLLGTFNPTPTTTVFIPYEKEYEGSVVKTDYFGELPADRIAVRDGVVYFRIDGAYRAKIGLPQSSARDICGSYDSARHILNILKYTVPQGPCNYVNSQWGHQDNPFGGDVINSYNDGPTENGTIMGPFYEIETSSPAAELAPGQSLTHTQCTMHFEGDEESLSVIAKAVFGVDLHTVASVFPKQ